MTFAKFHLADGECRQVPARLGLSLMEAAKAGNVPGIEADCGGSMVCGTCHVIVAQPWLDRLPKPSDMELAILDGVPDPHPQARLSCQITMSPEFDGIEVTVPASQR